MSGNESACKMWRKCQRQKKNGSMMEEKREMCDGERERDEVFEKGSMWCKRKWVSISPLFDSLFSVATPGKESRQLAPHHLIQSICCNTTTVRVETIILILN